MDELVLSGNFNCSGEISLRRFQVGNYTANGFKAPAVVEDLMAIIHTFSCRLYGLRKYKNDLKKIVEANEDNTDTL